MAFILNDEIAGIDIPKAYAKISHYTVNESGLVNDEMQKLYNVVVYLDFYSSEKSRNSDNPTIYKKEDISIDGIIIDNLKLEYFYITLEDMQKQKILVMQELDKLGVEYDKTSKIHILKEKLESRIDEIKSEEPEEEAAAEE